MLDWVWSSLVPQQRFLPLFPRSSAPSSPEACWWRRWTPSAWSARLSSPWRRTASTWRPARRWSSTRASSAPTWPATGCAWPRPTSTSPGTPSWPSPTACWGRTPATWSRDSDSSSRTTPWSSDCSTCPTSRWPRRTTPTEGPSSTSATGTTSPRGSYQPPFPWGASLDTKLQKERIFEKLKRTLN